MEINEKLSSVIFNVGREIRGKIDSGCGDGFTQAEIEVLKFVEKNKSAKMKNIADYLRIKPASATSAVQKLVKKGYLKRVESKDDRRIVNIVITPWGLKSLQKKYKKVHNIISKVFEKLNKKDKQILIKILEKIND